MDSLRKQKTLNKCDLNHCLLKGAKLCAVSEGHSRRNIELKVFSEVCLLALSCNAIKQDPERAAGIQCEQMFQMSVKYGN